MEKILIPNPKRKDPPTKKPIQICDHHKGKSEIDSALSENTNTIPSHG